MSVTAVDRGIFQMALFLVDGTSADRWVGNFLFRLLPQKGGSVMELTPDHGDPCGEVKAPPDFEVRLEDPHDPGDLQGYTPFEYKLARMRLPR